MHLTSRLGGPALMVLVLAAPVSAQNAAAPDKREQVTDRVIISNLPEQKSRIRSLLSTYLGNAGGDKLGVTQSEVWSVPRSLLARLSQTLKVFGCTVTRLGDDWNHILKRHEGPVAMSPAQEEVLKKRSSPGMVGMGVMKAQKAAIAEYALTGGEQTSSTAGGSPPEDMVSSIVLPINDTQHVTIQRVRAVTKEKGMAWRGVVEETGESAVLMWWKDGHLSGVLGYKGRIYSIENMGGDVHAVIEFDPKKLPPDHAIASSDTVRPRDDGLALPGVQTPKPKDVEPLSDAERLALEAKDTTIDVMILYTRKAASRYICDPADLLELGVEQVNETFRNSGVRNVKLRLVHTQLVDYEETVGDQFNHLYRMVDGVGPFKDVRRLRDDKRADIVGMIVDDPSGCGLSTRVGADAEEAYFVVHHSCATLTMSIAHEVGHILGARHDRAIDGVNSPFPYGHGYINGTKWRDIMSYQQACNGCLRIPFWSNPRVTYKGEPTGTLTEDNARLILEQAERVSKFR